MRASCLVTLLAFLAACSPSGGDDGLAAQPAKGAGDVVNLCKGVICSTGNPCISGACDPGTGACVQTPLTGKSCSDGQACTLVDVCRAGVCTGTESTCGMAVQFSPTAPRTDADITASLSLPLDPALTVSWVWTNTKKAVTYPGATLPWTLTDRADRWVAAATIADAAGNAQTVRGTVIIADTPPSITAVTLAPASPARTDTLRCAYTGWSDADTDPPHATVAWFAQTANGPVAIPGTALLRKANDLAVGESVFCQVTPRDSSSAGAPVASPAVTIVNLAPVLISVALTSSPTRAVESATLTCAPKGVKDPEGDALTTTFAWFVNGAPLAGATGATLAGAFVKTDSVNCQVTVVDPYGASATATSPAVVIQASLPVIGAVTVSGASACGDFTCAASNLTGIDAGDTVTLHYKWLINGTVKVGIPDSASTLPSGIARGGDQIACSVRADVGTTGKTGGLLLGPATQSQPVTASDNPPVIASVSLPASVTTWNQTFTCAVSVSDDCDASPAITYAWQIDGLPVGGATGATFSDVGGLGPSDTLTCSAIASDGVNTVGPVFSNSVALLAQPPTLQGVTLTTADGLPAQRASTLRCDLVGLANPGGGALSLSYGWTDNGVPVPGPGPQGLYVGQTLAGTFVKGDLISCSATVADAYGDVASAQTLAPTVIQDSLPVVGSATIAGSLACGRLTCQTAGLFDGDGDTVTVHYRWLVEGVAVAGATSSTFTTDSSASESVTCAARGDDGTQLAGVLQYGAEVQSQPVLAMDTPPAIASVAIPPSPKRADTLTCVVAATDDCAPDFALSYSWRLNGAAVASGPTFAASAAKPGDAIVCVATASDGSVQTTQTSNTAIVADVPPVIASIAVTTTDARPTVLSTLACAVQGASDADGDPLTTSYAWFVNGAQLAANGPTLANAFAKGQAVSCSALVSDGFATGSLTSAPLVILDAPPVVASAAVAGQDACGAWTCSAAGVADPDGDPITLHYAWRVDGAIVDDATGFTLAAENVSAGDEISCAVSGDDGTVENGALLLGPQVQSPQILADDLPPAIAAVSIPASAHVWNTALTCSVAASDDCTPNLSFTYSWQLDGQAIAGATSATLAPLPLGLGDAITCTATASDGTHDIAQTSNAFSIVDQAPSLQGAFVATADGASPTRLSALLCTPVGASDPDGDALAFTVSWSVNGAPIASGATLSGAFARGDQVSCALAASDGYLAASAISAPLVIGDAPPAVATVTASGQTSCGAWTCAASGFTDADGDATLAQHYRWFINGAAVPGSTDSTFQSSLLANGQTVSCGVSLDDGVLTGPETLSPAITVADVLPTITSITVPATIHDYLSTVFTCAVTVANDCDPNPNIAYTWYVDSLTLGTSSSPTLYDPTDIAGWGPSGQGDDFLSCSARVTNAAGTSAIARSNRAYFVDQRPVINSVAITTSDGNPPSTDNLLTCTSDASDPDGDPLQTTYWWWVNGQGPISINTQTLTAAQAGLKVGDAVYCRLDVIDPLYGENQQSSAAVTIEAPVPGIAAASLNGSYACGALYCDVSGLAPANGKVDYEWLVNGAAASGQTGSSFATTALQSGDSVACAARGDNGATIPGELAHSAWVQSAPVVYNPNVLPTMTTTIPAYIHGGQIVTAAYTLPEGCGNPFDTVLQWYVNGQRDNSVGGSTKSYDTSKLGLGDTLSVVVFVAETYNEIVGTSNIGTVGDQPPTLGAVSISTADSIPRAGSVFTCAASGVSDPDGDAWTVSYEWWVNSSFVGHGATSTPFTYHRGDRVSCIANASDGQLSTSLSSASVLIQPTAPSISGAIVASSDGSFDVCKTFSCNPIGTIDADNLPVTMHRSWFINGSLVSTSDTLGAPTIGAGSGGDTVSCTITPDDGAILNGLSYPGATVASPAVIAHDTAPAFQAAPALPASAHVGTTIHCSAAATDDCSSSPALSYAWTRNGQPLSNAGSALSTTGFAPGDSVVCSVTASDGFHQTSASSNPLAVTNSPPAIASASLIVNGPAAYKSSILTCAAGKETDADRDALTTSYTWQVNGQTAPGATGTTLSGAFKHADVVTCTATVSDPWSSAAAVSNAVTIQDSAPFVGRAFAGGTNACGASTCTTTPPTDADGDAVTLTYQWLDNGVPIASSNSASFITHARAGDVVTCSATPSDGSLSGGAVLSSPIVMTLAPPQATATLTPASIGGPGPTLTCNAAIIDACAVSVPDSIAWQWTLNGAAQPTTAQTFPTAGLHTGDLVACRATVTGEGGTATASSGTVAVPATNWTMTGTIAGGQAGFSVAVIDDLNKDGLREVAIGAPNTTDPRYVDMSRAGAVYVVNGQNRISATSLGDVILGKGGIWHAGQHGSQLTSTMVCNANVIYPAPGCPLVHDINTSDITAEISGPDGAGLGFSLAYAGDVDGDGVGDLIVGAPWDQVSDIWTGRAYMLTGAHLYGRPIDDAVNGNGGYLVNGECGRRRNLDYPHIQSFDAANGDLFGYRIAAIGDVNGDGLGDFAVSAPNNGDLDEGTVYVVYGTGSKAGLNAADLFSRGCAKEDRPQAGNLAGTSGYAIYASEPSGYSTPQLWGANPLASLGDVNGDGYDDFLVGNPGQAGNWNDAYIALGGPAGSTQVIGSASGTGSLLALHLGTFNCSGSGNGSLTCHGLLGAGYPIGGGGDVNGDGIDDVVAHAQHFDTGGFLEVLYGGAQPDSNRVLQLSNAVANTGLGFEVTGSNIDFNSTSGVAKIVGDLNGDGYDDVAIGVPTQGGGKGAVYVVFGGATPQNLTVENLRAGIGGFAIEPGVAGAQFGASIASGDIDGDGISDLIIGAPGAAGVNGEVNAGAVQVIFGQQYAKSVSFLGTPGDDLFTGSSAGESIIGGRGNDHLIGGGGADVIYGGAGDDVIEVDDDSFRRVNGGAGNDTLILGASVTHLALTGPNKRRIQEIERIQLAGQSVTLNKLGLAGINSAGHKLQLFGAGSLTILPGDHWTWTSKQTPGDGSTYNVLTDGVEQLWISTSITTSIPPTIISKPLAVPENSAVGTVVAALLATDPDGDSAQVRWAMVSDPSGAFRLDASTGALIVKSSIPLDYESSQWPWSVVVSATDQTGLVTQATYAVSLLDVPEPPVFTGDASYILEQVNEDATGALFTLTALDPDQGDSVTYSLVDASGLLSIDPVSGVVSLLPGKVFNASAQVFYSMVATATDTTGHAAAQYVNMTVNAVTPLTTTAHVEFDLNNWSTYQDSASSEFAGLTFPGFTPSQVTTNCAGPDVGAGNFAQGWNPQFLNGPGPVSLPIELSASYSGALCTSSNLVYDSGTYSAKIPYDVTFSYPDAITEGSTISFSSSAVLSSSGYAMWGTTAGADMSWSTQFKNFGADIQICDRLLTGQCGTIANFSNLNGTYATTAGLPPAQWKGVSLNASSGLSLGTSAPIHSYSKNLGINWDALMNDALQAVGGPSIYGTGQNLWAGTDIAYQYQLLHAANELLVQQAWDMHLDTQSVTGVLTLEDGTQYNFTLGGTNSFYIPFGADKDHDGVVGLTIQLRLNADFNSTWTHTEALGYAISAGYVQMVAKDALGNVLAKESEGPAWKKGCLPLQTNYNQVQETAKTIGEWTTDETCVATTAIEHFHYSPGGFNQPVIHGGFPLGTR